MKAVITRRFGTPDVLEVVHDYPRPSISANQVLIQVHAAGINPLDWKIRQGKLRILLGSKFPLILGNDASGVIVETGIAVTKFKVGDEVFCLLDQNHKSSWTGFAKSGAYAEFAVTREDTIAVKPPSLSHQEAASIPLAALTAYQALRYRAGLNSGKKILINGASGGVGTFAVQVAKSFGAIVTAVCSKRNRDLVVNLGADCVIDYKKQKIAELDERFDVIYDVAATSSFYRVRHILTKGGIFISNIANPISLISTFLFPALKIIGVKKRNSYAWVRSSGEDLKTISQMIDNGKLRTVIDRVYAMDEIQRYRRN